MLGLIAVGMGDLGWTAPVPIDIPRIPDEKQGSRDINYRKVKKKKRAKTMNRRKRRGF